ncbi:unnamed protein product [Linum tenue]|uniref:Uncharacterized protein n=1 Tax=Linum tenue TaxID=586396 RepID=A0AAV0RLY8_9ROSI|nr:unnamed protein product [Linum tenue]
MGWPIIGETLELYSQDPTSFFSSKQKRHGEIFKTHILGCPCVMLASPEAARFVLVTQAHLFRPTYPKSKERLIGPAALFFHQGEAITTSASASSSSAPSPSTPPAAWPTTSPPWPPPPSRNGTADTSSTPSKSSKRFLLFFFY